MTEETSKNLVEATDTLLSRSWYHRVLNVAGTTWTAHFFATQKTHASSFEAGLKDPRYLPQHLKASNSPNVEGLDPTSVIDDEFPSGCDSQSSTPETPRANSTGAQTPIKKPYGDVTFTSVLEGPATPPREHQRHVASACCASLAASSKNSNTRQAKTKKKIRALKRALLLSAIAAVAAMAGQKARRCDKKQKS